MITKRDLEGDCPVWYESRLTCRCMNCTLARIEVASKEPWISGRLLDAAVTIAVPVAIAALILIVLNDAGIL